MNKIVYLFLLLGLSFSSFGQNKEQPVEWSFTLEIEEEKGALIIAADIKPGWYIYASTTPKGGPIATSFTFDDPSFDAERIVPIGDLIVEQSELFEMEVHKYKNHVEFKQDLSSMKSNTISGKVRYMCCNSVKCLPPTDVPFQLIIQE